MGIEKSLKNALLTANGIVSFHNNEPIQYNGKQRQYFSPETRTFTQKYAKYASDFIEAQMQGIDPDHPFEYQTRLIRMADIVKPTAAIQRNFDDYKTILVADRDIEYIMPGSKVLACGSTWVAFNPLNISGSDGAAVVRRCNAVWNYLDFYGNVCSEPIIVENARANANDSDAQNSQYINKGYFNITCQNNDATRQIDTNTRMILGSSSYRVTGPCDFIQEFTGDYSSVRMLTFSVRYEEDNDCLDDMENHVAGGKSFSWQLSVSCPQTLPDGGQAQIEVQSVRNGETVESTTENPISYLYNSSDHSVLQVNKDGVITAKQSGAASIRVTLAQNPLVYEDIEIVVDDYGDMLSFTSTVPESLSAYETVTITAAYFSGGVETDEPLVWLFERADDSAYKAVVAQDGKSATITCYGYSATPLRIAIEYGGEMYDAANINLQGI